MLRGSGTAIRSTVLAHYCPGTTFAGSSKRPLGGEVEMTAVQTRGDRRRAQWLIYMNEIIPRILSDALPIKRIPGDRQ